jgi:invasion protein IalB
VARATLRGLLVLAGIAGIVLLAWAGAQILPLREMAGAVTGPRVSEGFVGREQFGDWRLICVPGPDARVAVGPGDAPANAGNACRLNQEVTAPDDAGQVILAANLSVVGPLKKPALMVRLPPTFQAGDSITLRIDQDRVIRTAIRDCSERECVAASDLSEEDWPRLVAAEELQVMFRMADGKTVFVPLGTDGLSEAAEALNTAQASSQ